MKVEDALWHIRNVYANLSQKDSRVAEPYGIAIEALEKQIPQKVWYDSNRAYCPVCWENVKSYEDYCPCCGQLIDWEEEKTDAEEIH